MNPGLLQHKDMLRFSLNWADFMFQGAQAPMALWVGAKSLGLPFLAVDEIQPDKADPWFPALLRASPAHPADGDSVLLAFLRTPLCETCVSSMWITRYEWKHHASWLPAEVIYLLEMSAGLFPPHTHSLPLLLPDPHLGKQMKCQEEMSLQQASSLWGISCTLIMVFVLWVVKFPSTSPVWS